MRTSSFFMWIILSLLALIINSDLVRPTRSQSLDCNRLCGGIQIPYPFGIGEKECYLNDWYEVVCHTTTTSGKSKKEIPFLSKIKKEVVNISFASDVDNFNGIIHIKSPVTSSGCAQLPENPPPLNLTGEGSPFFITKNNILISVGCNTRALITVDESQITGCETKCNKTKTYLQELTNDICTGYGCCQAKIPIERSQVINVNLETRGGNFIQGSSCNVAFLTSGDEMYYPENVTKPEKFYTNGLTIIELGWLLDISDPRSTKLVGCFNFTEAGVYTSQNSSYSCMCEYGYFSGFGYSICECNDGFRGNPYLPGGCLDIDECEGITRNMCRDDENCVNAPGSYKCEAIKVQTLPRAIIGLIISLVILVLVLVIWGLVKFIKKRRMTRSVKERRKMILMRTFLKRDGTLLLKQQLTTEGGSNVPTLKIFSSKELDKATDNFNENRVLGQGSQGTVYRGMLNDGSIVAAKRSKILDERKFEEFINEVGLISQLNHRNIVRLIGCCLEAKLPVLVYEYVPNGDLYERLHSEADDFTMTWDLRMRIAMDTAEALAYLHSASFTPMYHRDVKTLNILLDENYRAKLSDFGASRSIQIDQTHLTTHVVGTYGYIDPECHQTGRFTEKSDVYSFGVILVELITGEKPVSVSRPEESRSLAPYFIEIMKEKRVLDIVDSRIRKDCNVEQVMAMAHLARRCLNTKGRNRPSMRQVSIDLERIRLSPLDLELHAINEEDEEEEAVASASTSTSMEITIDDGGRGDTIEEIDVR